MARAPGNQLIQRAVTPSRIPGPTGNAGDSSTVQAELDHTARGGTLTLPEGGVYTIATTLVVPPDITVDGNGSVLETAADSTTPRSQDPIMRLSSGDTIHNLVFDGNVHSQNGVWTQHRHAITIGAASDVKIEENTFQNLIGDGIYSTGASSLTIDNNQFNGDHSNRNGISIISGSHVRIYDNTFWSMARPDMPAAIDLEPNMPSQTLSDVVVYDNTINDPAEFGMLEYDSVHAAVSDITFKDNAINGGTAVIAGGIGILIAYGPATVTGNYVNNCPGYNGIYIKKSSASVTGNHLSDVEWGITLERSPTATISGNTFSDISGGDETHRG